MSFVSMTTMPRASAEKFNQQHGITWSSGYGTSRDLLASFGAFNHGMPGHGYETAPTLFVIGADGRVAWNDGKARMSHRGDAKGRVADVVRELDAAISRAVADATDKGGSD